MTIISFILFEVGKEMIVVPLQVGERSHQLRGQMDADGQIVILANVYSGELVGVVRCSEMWGCW